MWLPRSGLCHASSTWPRQSSCSARGRSAASGCVVLACTVAVCAILAIAYLSMGVRFDGAPALISYLLEPLFVPLYLIVLAVVHLFDFSLDRG